MAVVVPAPLSTFALVAPTKLIVTVTAGLPTAIRNGTYGSSDLTDALNPGEITGTSAAAPGSYANDLSTLATAIASVSVGTNNLTKNAYGTETLIFNSPGRHTRTALTFVDTTIKFTGTSTDQFFIHATGPDAAITFTRTRFILDGVLSSNIFWMSGTPTIGGDPAVAGDITFTDVTLSIVPGYFVAPLGDLTATSTSQTVTPVSFAGAIYVSDEVTFTRVSYVDTTPVSVADICFPGDTPVITDQGEVEIALVNPEFHTIRGNKIVAVTKTIGTVNFLVCFEKDSLGENLPSRRTIMSKHHSVEYEGKLRPSHTFVGQIANVNKVDYTGEPLYNILMEEHSTMTVNGLTCETLHPDNRIAKLYTGRYEIPIETPKFSLVLPKISAVKLIRGY